MTPATLEVCVDTAKGVATCADASVDRIELCAALGLGGLTPSVGLMRFAAACGVPTHAMIRPRAGDFRLDEYDLAQMCDDIEAARQCGLAGVVIGAALDDGTLDVAALTRMIDAAGKMDVTLHRVIDLCPDPLGAIDQAVGLGIGRILTSGGQQKAIDGAPQLAAMHSHAAGRITIMAGSGVTAANVGTLASTTGIRDFHASCAVSRPWPPLVHQMGFGEMEQITDRAKVNALKTAIARV